MKNIVTIFKRKCNINHNNISKKEEIMCLIIGIIRDFK